MHPRWIRVVVVTVSLGLLAAPGVARAEIVADDGFELVRRIAVAEADDDLVAGEHDGAAAMRQLEPLVLADLVDAR